MPRALGRQQDQPSRGRGATWKHCEGGKTRTFLDERAVGREAAALASPEGGQHAARGTAGPHVGAEAWLFQKIPSQVAGQDMWEVSAPETGV